MNSLIEVRKIEWMEQDAEMTLTIMENQGLLSYESQMILPANCLNQVLNELQKQLPEGDIQNCMTIEQWSVSEINYVFQLSKMSVGALYLNSGFEREN